MKNRWLDSVKLKVLLIFLFTVKPADKRKLEFCSYAIFTQYIHNATRCNCWSSNKSFTCTNNIQNSLWFAYQWFKTSDSRFACFWLNYNQVATVASNIKFIGGPYCIISIRILFFFSSLYSYWSIWLIVNKCNLVVIHSQIIPIIVFDRYRNLNWKLKN